MDLISDGPLVLVNGWPASGKTTLARPLARLLDVPYIAKDVIKEAVGDIFGAVDLTLSKKIGHAAVATMHALAAEAPRAVLDSFWHPEFNHELLALDRPLLEVFCACPRDVAVARCRSRLAERHHVHCDVERLSDSGFDPSWGEVEPLALGPVLRVDTTVPIDVDRVATWVRAQDAWAER